MFIRLFNRNKFNDFNRDEIESKEQFSSVTKYAAVTLKNGVKYIKGAAEVLVNQCAFFNSRTNRCY